MSLKLGDTRVYEPRSIQTRLLRCALPVRMIGLYFIDSCITQLRAQGPARTRVSLNLRLKDLLGPVTRVKKKQKKKKDRVEGVGSRLARIFFFFFITLEPRVE